MTNVLIVDDERVSQELFTHYISTASDRYSLVAAVREATNAELYCVQKKVDLILMDICTAHDESGIEATAQIKRKYPLVKVVIVTSAPDFRFLEKSRRAGADSFWYKEVSPEELLDVMDRTMAGESVYPDSTPVVKVGLADSDKLTPTELQVMFYLAENRSLHEIAELMGVDYTTTRTHIRNLKLKTGAKDLSALCGMAARSRLILPDY